MLTPGKYHPSIYVFIVWMYNTWELREGNSLHDLTDTAHVMSVGTFPEKSLQALSHVDYMPRLHTLKGSEFKIHSRCFFLPFPPTQADFPQLIESHSLYPEIQYFACLLD